MLVALIAALAAVCGVATIGIIVYAIVHKVMSQDHTVLKAKHDHEITVKKLQFQQEQERKLDDERYKDSAIDRSLREQELGIKTLDPTRTLPAGSGYNPPYEHISTEYHHRG